MSEVKIPGGTLKIEFIPDAAVPAPTPVPTPTPVNLPARAPGAMGKGLYVSGSKLYHASGLEFIPRGVNSTCWWGWREHNFASIAEIAKTGANSIRLAFGSGIPNAFNSGSDRLACVAEAVRVGLVPVVGLWEATGKQDPASLLACVDTWLMSEHVSWLVAFENKVILNIANEWGPFDGKVWSDTYITAVKRIRAAGIFCAIQIDAGGAFGQNPRSVRDFGAAILAADPEKNVHFSVHMYAYWRTTEGAGEVGKWNDFGTNSPWDVYTEMKSLKDKGLCVVVGELGYGEMNLGVRSGSHQCPYVTKYALSTLKSLGIGFYAWSWNQNSDSALDLMRGNSDYLYTGPDSLSLAGLAFIDALQGK